MRQRRPSRKDRELVRLLLDPQREKGDLAPDSAGELRRQIERDPERAARFERLRSIWEAIEPPPAAPGFAGRVMARVRETAARRSSESLAAAPLWVRSSAAVALVVGLAGGLLMGRLPAQTGPTSVEIAEALEAGWLDNDPSLAESYLSLLEEPAEPRTGRTGGGELR